MVISRANDAFFFNLAFHAGFLNMLLVVCPNLAVDRVLEVDGFRPAAVQRSRSVLSQPGGKGSNVARVFRQLGGDVVLTGFVGRRNASWITDPLRSLGVQVEAIEAYPGESRTCTVILNRGSLSHPTVINEESPQIEAGAAEALLAVVKRWLSRARYVLVTGSLSCGLPPDFYGEIIALASGSLMSTAIDATGDALRLGLLARPDLVKANLDEMRSVFGGLEDDIDRMVASLKARVVEPSSQILVTLGEAGAILVNREGAWHAKPPRISHINPIGAGDSFAAGFIKARLDGDPPEVALQLATAAAVSDASTLEPGRILSDEIGSLVSGTALQRW